MPAKVRFQKFRECQKSLVRLRPRGKLNQHVHVAVRPGLAPEHRPKERKSGHAQRTNLSLTGSQPLHRLLTIENGRLHRHSVSPIAIGIQWMTERPYQRPAREPRRAMPRIVPQLLTADGSTPLGASILVYRWPGTKYGSVPSLLMVTQKRCERPGTSAQSWRRGCEGLDDEVAVQPGGGGGWGGTVSTKIRLIRFHSTGSASGICSVASKRIGWVAVRSRSICRARHMRTGSVASNTARPCQFFQSTIGGTGTLQFGN